MTDNQTNLTDNQANMPDNQEREEPPQCYTYVQKDGETISVSKATHSNIYEVVRYLVKEKQLTQPIMWGTSDFKKAQAVIRKRKQREKELEEADGEEPEPKKRKVPAKFKKTLRSFMFTCPRVKETEGVNARTQWLDVFKSLPNNTLSNALVVLEPHMPDEGILDEWAEDTEEAKPPNHIHAFVWYDEPTDLLTVVKHVHAQMPGYMEDTRDSGIGLKGTFEFTPGLYGETNPCWAAHYCGIRDEHEIDSYAEVLKYKRVEGDSAYASGCGHLKQADAAPEIYGFEPGTLFPIESRQASKVVKELGHKYLCFSFERLVRELIPFDLEVYQDRVMGNSTYKTASASNDLHDMQLYLDAKGLLSIEPMEDKIQRYAAAALDEQGDDRGPYYRAIEGVFDNSPHIDKHALSKAVYNMLIHGPSKQCRVPFLYGDSNSGKSTVLDAIKLLVPTATHVSGDKPYDDLRGGTKDHFIWDDFHQPVGAAFHDMLSAFEGLPGHCYRVMYGSYVPAKPVAYFVTCEHLPTKKKKEEGGEWVVDEDKTKHFHNRLSPFGPFKKLMVTSDVRSKACPMQFCQWLVDNKDGVAPPVDEADIFVRQGIVDEADIARMRGVIV